MKRIALLLLLVSASLFVTTPGLADDNEDTWTIAVFVSDAETLVSPDARYCLMPASMPIRPGNMAILRDAENHTIGAERFYDAVEVTLDPERFAEDKPCHLIARFPSVEPQDGLRVVISPQPPPVERSAPLHITIDVAVAISKPFDWSYDEFGIKRCNPLGDIQLGNGSPVATTPKSRLYVGAYPNKTRFISKVEYSKVEKAEYCVLLASLEFPIADEYVIEFSGGAP